MHDLSIFFHQVGACAQTHVLIPMVTSAVQMSARFCGQIFASMDMGTVADTVNSKHCYYVLMKSSSSNNYLIHNYGAIWHTVLEFGGESRII